MSFAIPSSALILNICYLKIELLDTEGDASIAAGRVGVLELGDLWHRIF